jgi:GNAT superfamily N-acetyltransferase
MNFTIRIADERDWDAIAQLNHKTYALELGQYEPKENGRQTDKRHDTNVYIVAYAGEELAGMVAITMPGTAQISTLKRMKLVSRDIEQNLYKTAEIRLLAIEPNYRGQGLYDRLMFAVIQYCYQHGVERVLISAIDSRVSLYEFMGFRPIGKPVMEGTAVFLPMIITRYSLQASPFMKKVAMLQGLPVAA